MGLNRRVRYGNGCVPHTYRRQIFESLTTQQRTHHFPYFFLRKEVIQPLVLERLPCYDFTPVIGFALGNMFANFGHPQLPWCDGRCVQDPGTYSPRHSDPRLLAIPAS